MYISSNSRISPRDVFHMEKYFYNKYKCVPVVTRLKTRPISVQVSKAMNKEITIRNCLISDSTYIHTRMSRIEWTVGSIYCTRCPEGQVYHMSNTSYPYIKIMSRGEEFSSRQLGKVSHLAIRTCKSWKRVT